MTTKTYLASAALAALVATGAQAVGVSTETGASGDPASLLPDTAGVYHAATASAGSAAIDGAVLRPKTVDTAATASPSEAQWRTN